MKAKIDNKVFTEAVGIAMTACETKATIPTAGLVGMTFDENSLAVYGTNLDSAIKITVPAEVEEPGCLCLNARNINDWAKLSMAPMEISMIPGGPRVRFKSGCSVRTMGAIMQALPEMPESSGEAFPIRCAELASILSDVLFSAGNYSDNRYHYGGVTITARSGELSAFAMDGGSRFAFSSIASGESSIDASGAIASKTVGDILRLCRYFKEGDVGLSICDHGLIFNFSDFVNVYTRSVNTKPVDWRRVVPGKELEAVALVSYERLTLALERFSSVARESRRVEIKFSNSALSMASSEGTDSGEDEVECEYHGPEFSESVNCQYLIGAIQAAAGENVELVIYPNPHNPKIMVRRPGMDNFIAMIGGMR